MITPTPHTDGGGNSAIVFAAQQEVTLVKRYIDGLSRWLPRTPATRRTFVSLFSNPNLVRNAIARDLYKNACLSSFEASRPFERYLFATLQPQRLHELQQRYERHHHTINADVLFLTGDSNDLAHGIVGESIFHQESVSHTPSPTIVFINPDDLRLQWKTLQLLARLPNLYLILFYPMDALERWMARNLTSKFTTDADIFFGNTGWRDVYLQTSSHARALTLHDYYCDGLRDLGFDEIVKGAELGIQGYTSRNETRLYSLLLAHKSPMPRPFWDELLTSPVVRRPKDTGALRTVSFSI
jgi:three-Cys-motif partner protein